MIRHLSRKILPALLAASCVAPSGTYLGFTVGAEGAPPPPTPVVVEEPAVAVVPDTSVYVVPVPSVSYDMFRFGATWYMYSGGFWYRSGSHRGPFAAVDVRSVPREVVTVPPSHWKNHPHGGPPGLAKKRGYESG